MEALLGRYQMRYLDQSQGPPVYLGFDRAKSVNGITGGNFRMITTMKLECARALHLDIDSNLPDQTLSVPNWRTEGSGFAS